MSIDIYRRTTCRLCDSQHIETVLKLAPTPLAADYLPPEQADRTTECFPLDCALCHQCGHFQLLDVVSANRVYDDYIYYSALSPGNLDHFATYANTVIDRIQLSPNSLVVDIGSNDGTLLSAFQQRGYQVCGVEPASHIAEQVNAKGIPTHNSYFDSDSVNDIAAKHGKASLITVNHLLANVDDVRTFIQNALNLLTDDGVLIIESGYTLSLLEHMVFDNIYHEHYSYFAVKPLQQFFASLGLEIFHVDVVNTKGGSLHVFARRTTNDKLPVDASVAAAIAAEEKGGCYDSATFKAYGAKLHQISEQLNALLDKLIADGHKIAGYGASTSVTTVLYHFGIGDKLEFLVDDNSIKQGRISPGYHLPIFEPQKLYDSDIKHVVILPWRFGDQIIAKHQTFRDNGGKFITFLPEVAIK